MMQVTSAICLHDTTSVTQTEDLRSRASDDCNCHMTVAIRSAALVRYLRMQPTNRLSARAALSPCTDVMTERQQQSLPLGHIYVSHQLYRDLCKTGTQEVSQTLCSSVDSYDPCCSSGGTSCIRLAGATGSNACCKVRNGCLVMFSLHQARIEDTLAIS